MILQQDIINFFNDGNVQPLQKAIGNNSNWRTNYPLVDTPDLEQFKEIHYFNNYFEIVYFHGVRRSKTKEGSKFYNLIMECMIEQKLKL